MELVQYVATALLLSAQLALTYPAIDMADEDTCVWCPPGEYQKSCTACAPCPAGSYTSKRNQEDSCHRCFGDCRSDYNLRVDQKCTSTSNIKCVCKTGFTCTEKYDAVNCRSCEKSAEITTSVLTVTSGKQKETSMSASSGSDKTSLKPCLFPKCGPTKTVPPKSNHTDTPSSPLAAILSPVVIMGCMALVILFCIRRPGDETCFKQAIAKLHNEGGREASHKSRESTQFPRDSFSAKQQPSPLSVANLGPVHVHNPGTVIFSLLSQFTGQVGPTVDGKRAAEKVSSEEDDDRDCPVCHPTSSSSVHLSEEERSGETDSVFFPSQEQGKDCHISKEEEL